MHLQKIILCIASLALSLNFAHAAPVKVLLTPEQSASVTSEKLARLVDAHTKNSTGAMVGTESTQVGITRTRSDGSTFTITSEALSKNIQKMMANKIQSFLPKIDLEGAKTNEDSASNPKNWTSSFDISLVHEDARFVSIALDYYVYTGGAHGQHGRQGYVIDKKKKRFVRLNELFQMQKLIKKIGPEWEKQITEELGVDADLEWIHKGTIKAAHYRSFVITASDLIIYGQSYQHNSYAEGERTLVFPLSQLDALKKKYK